MASHAATSDPGARPLLDETRRTLADAQHRLETLLEVARLAREARTRRIRQPVREAPR